ncbi:MAG TPA: hypothetical protein VF199_09155 [Bacillales bacterium]
MTIPVDIEKTFIEIYERLQEQKIPWVLTGSLAFAMQGVPLTPNDIDIQTDRDGAVAIENLFKSFRSRAGSILFR